MESHKIQRLEFVSDKIEGVDCKREVICIRFCHPMKKNEIVCVSPWEAAMAGVEAPWEAAMGAPRRGERGGRRRGRERLGGHGWGHHGGGRPGCSCSLFVRGLCCSWLAVREGEEEREEREKKKKRKEKKRKERKNNKKYGKFSKLENFQKIKNNLSS
jgi:hypothetical protein